MSATQIKSGTVFNATQFTYGDASDKRTGARVVMLTEAGEVEEFALFGRDADEAPNHIGAQIVAVGTVNEYQYMSKATGQAQTGERFSVKAVRWA